jgi:2-desacetyl-2-hydroxyethyl bacteriochlorophyllide A dehydrogenase
MRALVFHGPEDVRCENVPDPTPDDARAVVLQVERAAICGSDLHLYHGSFPVDRPGFTIGHEFVGEVVETGSAVQRFRSGDRVLASGVVGCGDCAPCQRGEVTHCMRFASRVFGTRSDLPGGQAEAVAVPLADQTLCAIPDGVTSEQAVLLTDILPTGYFGARNAEIRPGTSVCVVGLGPVGQLALLFGPARVFALDPVEERRRAAEALGATALAPGLDAEQQIRDATDGAGPDAVIEAVGHSEAIQSALRLARPGGVVSVVGVNVEPAFPFPMALALMKNLTFRIGVCPIPSLWEPLVPLVQSGRLRPERVFTHEFPLSKGADAYRQFDQREGGIMKVTLDPRA